MRWVTDVVYLLTALVTAPIWLARMIRTGKIRTDWAGRLGAATPPGPRRRPRVLVHAVSVGEVNAVRDFVAGLAAGADAEVVVATTTDTGFARAARVFSGHQVVRYPFDFSMAVDRFLRRVQPDLVVLVELEVWPNFVRGCTRRGIPVCVINGRLSERSARRYHRVRSLVRPSFARLALAAVQNDVYAERFRAMGVPAERVRTTGTMKWDTARIADDVPGAEALAADLGIDRDRPLVVAGSTAPDEHRLLREAVPEGVQLLCAPRKPEWFDAAALDLPGCIRRTEATGTPRPAATATATATGRFLLDTIGELRMAYALADLVVVGRSFGALHGSDMIEPVALGKATVVGPAVDDFAAEAAALRDGGGLVQVDAAGLPATIASLLADDGARRRLAECGREVVRAHQGATKRHVDLVRALLAGVVERNAKRNSPPQR